MPEERKDVALAEGAGDSGLDNSGAPPSAAVSTARFRPMPMPSMPFWIVLIAAIASVAIVVTAWEVILIFGIAVALSFLLLPIVNWLDNHGWPRTLAAALVVAVNLVIVVVILLGIAAIIVNQGIPFLESLPGLVTQLQADVAASTLPDWLKSTLDSILTSLTNAFAGVDVGSLIFGFIFTTVGIVISLLSLLFVPFFMLYFMRDQPQIAAGFYRSLPDQWRVHVTTAIGYFKDDFVKYFKAEVIVGSIVAVIVTIGCLVIGFIVGGPVGEFAFLLGLIAGIFELLPTIGPILALIPAVILALTTSPTAVVLVLVFYFVVFNIEGQILVPTIEGEVISFRAATVLFLIMVGFALGGLIGAILALPVGAIVRDLYTYFFNHAKRESLIDDGTPEIEPAT
jgi:predicted PurR-regulated permease PerM